MTIPAATRTLFLLNSLIIAAWVFIWPFVTHGHGDTPLFKLAAIASLLIFFLTLGLLLSLRLRSKRFKQEK
jgi:hypothetical protein